MYWEQICIVLYCIVLVQGWKKVVQGWKKGGVSDGYCYKQVSQDSDKCDGILWQNAFRVLRMQDNSFLAVQWLWKALNFTTIVLTQAFPWLQSIGGGHRGLWRSALFLKWWWGSKRWNEGYQWLWLWLPLWKVGDMEQRFRIPEISTPIRCNIYKVIKKQSNSYIFLL